MINKSGLYWHLYFNESCADEAPQILALIEKLFAEIAQMGDTCFVRVPPQIFKARDFATTTQTALVYCRISSKPPNPKSVPELLGL